MNKRQEFWKNTIREKCKQNQNPIIHWCDRCKKCKEIAFDLFQCLKYGFIFSQEFDNYDRKLTKEELYFYHATDLDNVKLILKDGCLKPSSITQNYQHDVTYNDRIYFVFNIKNTKNWVICEENYAIFRTLRTNLRKKNIEFDDISTGIMVKSEKINNLELSLNDGETWKKVN